MIRNGRKKKSSTLYCETCALPKRFDEARLLTTIVEETTPGETRPQPPVTQSEVTDALERRRAWDRALRGKFPNKDDSLRDHRWECNRGHTIATVQTLRICVVGLTETGKTHFLMGLFHLLFEGQIPHLRITLMSDREMHRALTDVRKVFDLHQVIPGTKWERKESVQPYSFGVRMDVEGGGTQTVAVEIYDFPGEFAGGGEVTTGVAPFVGKADALIFFINPLSIRKLTQGMPEAAARAGDAPGLMVARYANAWRRERGLPVQGSDLVPSDTPIGVVLNRADVLCHHPDPEVALLVERALKKEAPEVLGDLAADIDRHSHLTRSLLTGSRAKGLALTIEEDYPLARYFLASPLGGPPIHNTPGTNDAWRETDLTLGGVALPFLAVVYRLLGQTGRGQ